MTPRMLALLCITLPAVLPARARAQVVDTSPCPYVTCAVRLTVGFTGERLVRGEASDEVLKINFTGSNAADFLGRVESAAGPAKDFRTRRARAAVLGIIGGAAAAWFLIRAYESDDSTFETYPTSTDYAILFAGTGVSIWAAIEATRSRNALSRAVWEFNRAPVP